MPQNKSALKRDRQNLVRNKRNRIIKSKVHTAFRKLNEAMTEKNKELVEEKLRIYMSEVDKAVKKGILHTRKGARNKSRIVKKIKKVFNEGTKE